MCARKYARARAINRIIAIPANISIMIEEILSTIKEVGFQRSLERLNRITVPDDSRQGIPED